MRYEHDKLSPTNILNDQLHYKTHTLFDTIPHVSHTNISAIITTTNQKMNPYWDHQALITVHMEPKRFC